MVGGSSTSLPAVPSLVPRLFPVQHAERQGCSQRSQCAGLHTSWLVRSVSELPSLLGTCGTPGTRQSSQGLVAIPLPAEVGTTLGTHKGVDFR
jgi:hypothetical protein